MNKKMLSKTKPFKEVNLKMNISSNNPCGVSPSSHGTQNENFERIIMQIFYNTTVIKQSKQKIELILQNFSLFFRLIIP